jgi:hypothetical protein
MTTETQSFTTGLIITLAAFILVFAFVVSLINPFNRLAEEKKCTIEVLKASTASKNVLAPKEFTTAHCTAVNLGELNLENNNRGKTKLAKTIIDEASRCWKKFGQGQKNPLPGELIIQKKNCYTCATFRLPAGTKYTEINEALDSQLYINDNARATLASAFLKKGDSAIYGIKNAEVKTITQEGKEKEGLEATEWGNEITGVKTYYLTNIFVINEDMAGAWIILGFVTQDTFSKLALTSEEDLNSVCDQIWN